ATFAEDGETSNLSLANAKALGGVTILTGTETLTGNSGYYNATNNTANVTGNVVIKRGKNSLEGQKATVNLTTNISQIIGGDSPNERVKGIFYPKENQGS
ncbi:MAG: LptA/OstA family protein, partial [Pseudomonadota bacterium]